MSQRRNPGNLAWQSRVLVARVFVEAAEGLFSGNPKHRDQYMIKQTVIGEFSPGFMLLAALLQVTQHLFFSKEVDIYTLTTKFE